MSQAERSNRGRRRSHLLALEPRMMFDAAAAVTAEKVLSRAHAESGGAAHVQPEAVREAHAVAHPADVARTAPAASTPHQIIFIDKSVPDYQALAKQWASKGEVVLIDDNSDGLAQVEAVLAHESNVSAIHIVSHGEEGAFFLGTTKVDASTINGALKGELAQIGASLNPGGDILIYGCDFAEGADGAAALHDLAAATGRDVAASTDLTGASDMGGDWTLEAHDGAIQARALTATGWEHTLAANQAVPIKVTPDSLTVKDSSGTVLVSGSTGYTNNYSPAITAAGATAVWSNAATYNGQSLDLKATVVSIGSGNQVQFYEPGQGTTDPTAATFLITNNNPSSVTTPATVQIKWQLVLAGTDTPAPANVEFTIGDIDGIGGNPNTRETVSTPTDNLAYYTYDNPSDINITATSTTITASGTQNENTTAGAAEDPRSNVSFDWTDVSAFTLTYQLAANNGVTNKAQFYQDGNATLVYKDPQYVSIPRLDLDGNDSTATGNDAHFTYTAGTAGSAIVDSDTVVSNPMPDNGAIQYADITLTNAKAGDVLNVGTLPSGFTYSTDTSTPGEIHVRLTGVGGTLGSTAQDYEKALEAITFSNSDAAPDTTQRTFDVSFTNTKLTSNVAHSTIAINHAPSDIGTLPAQSTQDAQTVSYATKSGFTDSDGDTLTYSASGLPTGLTINSATGVISGTVDRSASQVNGGNYTVTVTATDPYGASAAQNFAIAVTNPPPVAVNDSATTAEHTPVTVAVLANDHDPDGDPISVTAASAAHGTVVRNADGTITYTPNAHYVGADTIAYTITDGQGGYSGATVAVTVTDVPPTANGTLANRSTQDAATVSYATASGFADTNGDTLTYATSGLPTGLTINSTTGVISGTLDRSASQVNGGAYTVTVTATDPAGGRATQHFGIAVTNPPPVAQNDSATTPENTPVKIAVLANDHDPDGDPLTVTAASASHGTVVRNADGTITYTPNGQYVGQDTIAYTISDGQGGTSSATVAVTITDVPPAASGALPQRSTVDSATVNWTTAQGFTDTAGNTLRYTASGLPAGLVIDPNTGVISGTLDHSASQAQGGHYTITVTATDPSAMAATQSFSVDVSNPAPHAGNDRASTHVDTAVTIPVLANDSDPDGDPISVTAATAGHGAVVINPDGTITYTPTTGFVGTDTIAYTITDGDGATARATVTVTVSDQAPTATPVGNQAALDGQAVSLPVGNAFVDPDGDALAFSATGLPAGLTIDRATGTIAGTIDRSASQVNGGAYDTIVTADDGHGGVTTTEFHWTITNPGPRANNDTATTDENTPVTLAPLANDTDPDGDPLSVANAGAAHGTVAINPDGTITYTPNANFYGTDTIRYTATDGQGGLSSAMVAVTVNHVDQAPTTTGLAPRTNAEGAPVSVPAGAAFADVDGDALTYTVTGLPAGLSIDPATGTISGTPTAGDAAGGPAHDGRYPVTVTATDPSGKAVSSAFTWTVTPAGPTARPDTASTPMGTPLTIDALANDSDPDGLPLTLTGVTASHGTAAIQNGVIVFTPDAGYAGPALVTYTVTDGGGRIATADAAVTVVPTDRAPVAQPIPDAYNKDGRTGVEFDAGSFFSDPDGDTLTYAATGLPAGLSIDPATGRITGTIDHDASQVNGGVYHTVVTATDPSGLSASSGFDWTIVNIAPTAHDDAATTREGVPVTVNVLANDVDPDGDPLHVTSAHAGHGSVAINPDGTIAYTPAAGFFGTDTITYAISDGNGGRSTASVVVTVTRDLPPVIGPRDPITVDPARPSVIDPLRTVSDPEGDPLTVTGATAAKGTVTINPDNTLTFTPTPGFTGSTTITFTVDDGHGGTATGTLVVRVAPLVDTGQLVAIGHGLSPAWEGPRDQGDPFALPGMLPDLHPSGPDGLALAPWPVPGFDPANPILVPGGVGRMPFALISALDAIRPLGDTRDLSDATPIGDAVEGAQSLDGVGEGMANGAGYAVTSEVARLQRLADFRDAAERLFAHRWQDLGADNPLGDFGAHSWTGFSTSAGNGGVMIETLVQGGAIYLDVRDTASDHASPIRSIDVTAANGQRPDWLTVDKRGFAIVEADALTDEIHLSVTAIRADGSRTTTPVVIQRATGEIEIDRRQPTTRSRAAQPLDATLHTPDAAHHAAAAKLHRIFQ